jgi:chromosome segregation ATPase
MVSVMEQAKEKHQARLLDLDVLRQRPQNELTEVVARLRTLRSELAEAQLRLKPASGENAASIRREIATLQSGITSLENEADSLESKLKRIDDEAAGHHAQIRELERPGDKADVLASREAYHAALDAARAAGAHFFLKTRAFETKHAATAEAQFIRQEFYERERSLEAAGWTDLDVVQTPTLPINFRPMLPPAGKS